MLHQRLTHLDRVALHLAEDTGMHAAGLDRRINGLRHDVGHTGMRRMAFDHNRAASGQRGGGVASGGGKGQREV